MAPVAIRDVRKSFGATEVIHGVNVDIQDGEFVVLVGPSGCGKSTLLELVAGLQEPDAGSVEVAGASSGSDRRQLCSFMPQRDLLLPWRDAVGNAALGLECQGVPARE
ncbi:MAG: ATP-binding cassette domain-containing protein, partial [Pseudomonadota bacterium]|nr:ATP-binding cassette domain-containing protein [Pseudomonadota bacterium]